MSHETQNGVALVTGASSGIGAIYADRLAKRGYDLILVARDEARLSTLSHRLAKETGRSVTPLRADLTNSADLAKVERVLREDEAVTMLVNNAGIGAVTPLLNTDVGTGGQSDRPQRCRTDAAHLCRSAGIRRARKRHHHQRGLDRGHFPRNAERRLRRNQGLRPGA